MKSRSLGVSLFLIIAGICAGALACQSSGSASVEAPTIVISNGLIIDGTGSPPVEDSIVVVLGERILFVGNEEDAPAFANAEYIDAEGRTLLPGIINAHVHEIADPLVRTQMLRRGVTSLGLTAASWADVHAITSDTESPSPRVFWCGPMLAAPDGFPGVGLGRDLIAEIANESEGRSAVRRLAEQGVSFVKIALELGSSSRQLAGRSLPVLVEEQVNAIVETAHSLGLTVRAHATDDSMARLALRCDVDSIEHLPRPVVSPQHLSSIALSDEPADTALGRFFPEYVDLLGELAAETVLVPTLTSAGRMLGVQDATQEERATLGLLLEAVGMFHRAGGLIALGNDFPEEGCEVGMPINEMLLLQRAGLSAFEIIIASTRNAAIACGVIDEFGTLEAGKLADILIVRGDPTLNIEDLLSVALVILGGVVVHD